MSRTEALENMERKLKNLKKGLIAGLVVVPLLMTVLFGIFDVDQFTLDEIIWSLKHNVKTVLVWTGVFYAILGVAAGLMIRRESKIQAVLRPIIEHGDEDSGRVVNMAITSFVRKNVNMNTLTALIEAGGRQFEASVTEPVGTALPALSNGDAVVVWRRDGAAVVAGGGGFLQTA